MIKTYFSFAVNIKCSLEGFKRQLDIANSALETAAMKGYTNVNLLYRVNFFLTPAVIEINDI